MSLEDGRHMALAFNGQRRTELTLTQSIKAVSGMKEAVLKLLDFCMPPFPYL